MNKRSSAPARMVAVAALVVALVVVIAIVGGALGGGGADEPRGHHRDARRHESRSKHVPATYEVKSGDTLISIAHEYAVPIVRIEALNPELDPQSLIVGQQIKLR